MLLLVSNQNPNSTLPDTEVYRGGNERLYTDKFDELASLINQRAKKKKKSRELKVDATRL